MFFMPTVKDFFLFTYVFNQPWYVHLTELFILFFFD